MGGGFDGGRHDLGDGITLDGRNIGGSHLMYGRVPRFDHRGVFLGYDYPTPETCNQYPGYLRPGSRVLRPGAPGLILDEKRHVL